MSCNYIKYIDTLIKWICFRQEFEVGCDVELMTTHCPSAMRLVAVTFCDWRVPGQRHGQSHDGGSNNRSTSNAQAGANTQCQQTPSTTWGRSIRSTSHRRMQLSNERRVRQLTRQMSNIKLPRVVDLFFSKQSCSGQLNLWALNAS